MVRELKPESAADFFFLVSARDSVLFRSVEGQIFRRSVQKVGGLNGTCHE